MRCKHTPQVFLFPKKLIKMVSYICKEFLWKGSHESSRKALVAWDFIYLPKSVGDISITDFGRWNIATLCKLFVTIQTRHECHPH